MEFADFWEVGLAVGWKVLNMVSVAVGWFGRLDKSAARYSLPINHLVA